MEFANLSFFGQSINNVANGKVESYELLLRESFGGNAFPQKKFISFLVDHEKHMRYMKWLNVELKYLLTQHPNLEFSFNLDHQELEYEETFELLRSLAPYADRLAIEITEVSPIKRFNNYYSTIHVAAIKYIHELGFRISLDDVSQGVNSFGNLLQVKDYIYRIKFSAVPFAKTLCQDSLHQLILFFDSLAKELGKDFVVEGVEDVTFANWLKAQTTSHQQGYLYERPHELIACVA